MFPHNGLNKLPEMPFIFPFNLTSKSTMAFLKDQSWCVFQSSGTQLEDQNKDFHAVLQTDLARSLALSVALAKEQDWSRNSVLMVSIPNLGSASDWLKICLWNFCSQSPQMSFCRGTPGG